MGHEGDNWENTIDPSEGTGISLPTMFGAIGKPRCDDTPHFRVMSEQQEEEIDNHEGFHGETEEVDW